MVVKRKLPDGTPLTIFQAVDQESSEKGVSEEVCLVLSETEFRHMTLQRFKDAVVNNLKRGIRYRYIIPSNIPFEEYFKQFKYSVSNKINIDNNLFQSVALNTVSFGLVTPLVLFDPQLPTGHGYLRHFSNNNYIWLKLERDRLDQAFQSFEYHWNSQLIHGSNIFVFISYSSFDTKIAKNVAQRLERIGIHYFLDRKDIDWGDVVNHEIARGLAKASHIIILVSPASLKSGWVSYEAGYATAMGKKILPLLTHPSIDLPGFIKQLHYKVDINDIENYFAAG